MLLFLLCSSELFASTQANFDSNNIYNFMEKSHELINSNIQKNKQEHIHNSIYHVQTEAQAVLEKLRKIPKIQFRSFTIEVRQSIYEAERRAYQLLDITNKYLPEARRLGAQCEFINVEKVFKEIDYALIELTQLYTNIQVVLDEIMQANNKITELQSLSDTTIARYRNASTILTSNETLDEFGAFDFSSFSNSNELEIKIRNDRKLLESTKYSYANNVKEYSLILQEIEDLWTAAIHHQEDLYGFKLAVAQKIEHPSFDISVLKLASRGELLIAVAEELCERISQIKTLITRHEERMNSLFENNREISETAFIALNKLLKSTSQTYNTVYLCLIGLSQSKAYISVNL